MHSKKPFLLLQSRSEDEASDDEYQAFLKFGGLKPAELTRLRLDMGMRPQVALDDYAGVLMGGGAANFAYDDTQKSPEQREFEAYILPLVQRIVATDTPFLGACLGEPVHQRDQVFGLPGEVGGDGNTAPWLRVRTETRGQGENETKRTLFTLKRSVTGQLDSIECETEVGDPYVMIAIVKELGFVPFSDLSKTRQTGKLDDIEVCIDSVEDLGDFMELERLADENADPAVITDDLWRIMAELGISRQDEVTDGYDILMKKLKA